MSLLRRAVSSMADTGVSISLGFIGPGTVGKAFLEQLRAQVRGGQGGARKRCTVCEGC